MLQTGLVPSASAFMRDLPEAGFPEACFALPLVLLPFGLAITKPVLKYSIALR